MVSKRAPTLGNFLSLSFFIQLYHSLPPGYISKAIIAVGPGVAVPTYCKKTHFGLQLIIDLSDLISF